jgi:glycosyltransferase involved in cell wall biosynthesis
VERKRRILFVEQFYFPDGWGGAELPLALTVHLARCGFDVEVLCGGDQYAAVEGDPPPDPRLHGVRIRRVPPLWRGGIHRAKFLRQLWFYLVLAPLLLLRRPPDLLVTQTNPPLGVILVAVAAQLWRTPLIIIAMDIYPEVLIAHGVLSRASLPGKFLGRVFSWAYRRAQRVVALGPVMHERLEMKGVSTERIVEIPNWATGAPGSVTGAGNRLRAEWNLEDKFVLLYSGNLGLAHEFNTFLLGVREVVRSVLSLRVVFIGGGRRLQSVRRAASELGLDSIVRFSDLLPAGRLPESFGIAHLAVVTLQPEFSGLVVPSKLQGYMARGVPVLYVGPDSDVSRFIARSNGDVCSSCDDVQGVATSLIDLAGNPARLAMLAANARQWYEAEFAAHLGLVRYEAVVRSVLGEAGSSP